MSQLVLPWPKPAFWRRLASLSVLIGVILYLAFLVREIWLPLGLAFLLATVLDPVVDRMELHGWKRGPATAFIFGSFLALVGGTLVLALPHVLDQLVGVQQAFTRYFPDSSPHGLTISFAKLRIPSGLVHPLVQSIISAQNGLSKSSNWLSDYGMSFVGSMVWVIFVPIVGFYALRDYHLLLGKALLLAPRRYRNSVQVYVAEVSAVFSRYLRGLAIVSVLNGLATWCLLELLRVPNAFLLAVIAGVLYSVPYVGALTTVVLTAAISFTGGGFTLMLEAVACSMVLHQFVFDQIITPRILGGQVGIHPILSIVALLIGNILLGVVGMVLAVPIAACIQIGVLALVPKLGAELDLHGDPVPDEAGVRADQIRTEHMSADTPDSIHESVVEAVDHIEAQFQAESAGSGQASST